MFRSCYRRFALLVLLVGPFARAEAQSDSAGVVRGLVLSAPTGDPLARAIVGVVGLKLTVTTDDRGRFVLRGLAAGEFRVQVRALGYRPAEQQVTVAITPAGGPVPELTFRLDAAPHTLRPVRTEAAGAERERFDTEGGVGTITLSQAAIAAVPAVGEADVLRTVQSLPGVTAKSDFTAGLNVRGGESDQNLVLLDGIPIYNPFHVGGLFGMFVDEAVGEVRLLSGGFPASYGGRLSSVLDVTSAEETRVGAHGSVSVSLLSASAAVGGAISGGKGSWNLAARRTYADLVASAFTDDGLPYHFGDVHLHASHLLPSGGTISVTGYAGRDALDGALGELGDSLDVGAGDFRLNLSSGDHLFDWANLLAGVTIQQPFDARSGIPLGNGRNFSLGDSAWLVQRVSISNYATDLDIARRSLVYSNRVREFRVAGALYWQSNTHGPSVGYEYSAFRVSYDVNAPQAGVELTALRQNPSIVSVFAEDRWQPHSRFILRPGVRADRISGSGKVAVSPRVSAKLFLTRDVAVTAAGGDYVQWIHGLRTEDVPLRVFDFWIASDESAEFTRARHGVGGIEAWLGVNRFVRLEGFVKEYDRLYEPNTADDPSFRGDEFLVVDGRSHGLDLYARQLERAGEPLSGWVAYSFTKSTRQRDTSSYPAAHDRRHTLNVVASYRAASRYAFGLRFGFGSGAPFTDVLGQAIRRTFDGSNNRFLSGSDDRELVPVQGERNAARFPVFHRLDLSVSRRYAWRGAAITPSLHVVNVYNRENVFAYNFQYGANPPTRTAISQFPIIPSFGLQVEF